MDLSEVVKKLCLSESKHLIRKAAELRRLCDVQFDSSIIGVGEVCKAIICLEIAATRLGVLFDRQSAIRLSGMSEKAYSRSFNSLQNGLGVKNNLDVRELAIQFGCVRLIPFVKKGLSLYKERFLASLPASRRASADFTRPLFTSVAFYLCAKMHKLKVDKLKLIELCGASEPEFSNVSTSMKDLCHDVFGVAKEKKDAGDVKGNRAYIFLPFQNFWTYYLGKGKWRMVVIYLMMKQSFQVTRRSKERKNMLMRSGNLLSLHLTTKTTQKVLKNTSLHLVML
ncbi:hypothetical protein F2P56_035876 [Juglans regia]|uniref:Origin of replication complex subunit 6 n=2 Tax=Juglans regia TaxID=51240 RepID=A0A2I4GML5_JUGRE|nr:origin of replication complex subunit 6-like isoform X2 [Juglans regia]XP_035542537.1 origin of replication complex subunit 6-like isoform X2 [Juglans regia]KAF5443313.1 hypothetical protein F2P56_035876 [Juglans regia]